MGQRLLVLATMVFVFMEAQSLHPIDCYHFLLSPSYSFVFRPGYESSTEKWHFRYHKREHSSALTHILILGSIYRNTTSGDNRYPTHFFPVAAGKY